MISLALAFLLLGLTEAVIKPLAKRFVQRQLINAAPKVFELLDPVMPDLVKKHSAEEIQQIAREKFSEITGEDWSKANIEMFWQLYDPRRNAERLSK